MPELTRQHALTRVYQTGQFGQQTDEPIQISQRTGLSIIQIAAFSKTAEQCVKILDQQYGIKVPAAPCRAEKNLLWVGSKRWWLVQPETEADLAKVKQDFDAAAAITEHSQGRVVLRLSGQSVRDLLSKGSKVDFYSPVVTKNWCRPLPLDHFDVVLHCLAKDQVDVYVNRSFALSFWEWLIDAAAEFGGEVMYF